MLLSCALSLGAAGLIVTSAGHITAAPVANAAAPLAEPITSDVVVDTAFS